MNFTEAGKSFVSIQSEKQKEFGIPVFLSTYVSRSPLTWTCWYSLWPGIVIIHRRSSSCAVPTAGWAAHPESTHAFASVPCQKCRVKPSATLPRSALLSPLLCIEHNEAGNRSEWLSNQPKMGTVLFPRDGARSASGSRLQKRSNVQRWLCQVSETSRGNTPDL